MKIELENLGVLREAEFSLNDFTVICGENNTGKSYAVYALFGFLRNWRQYIPMHNVDNHVESILQYGVSRIDLSQYVNDANKILEEGCQQYAQQLSEVFASKTSRFRKTNFRIQFDESEFSIRRPFQRTFNSLHQERIFSLDKQTKSEHLAVSLIFEKQLTDGFPKKVIADIISNSINEFIFSTLLPEPFMVSGERTGATVFRHEFGNAHQSYSQETVQGNQKMELNNPFSNSSKEYALPIKSDVEFVHNLQSVVKESSFLKRDYPDILSEFSDLLGGKYLVDQFDILYFVPKGKSTKLEMAESSSSVRSLLQFGIYLHHLAKPGDLLLIDEPELNLHPENQCNMARLLVKLMNLGIRIFITTHSDYLLKELNTLIMLHSDQPHLMEIAERESYRSDELLDPNKLSVYIAQEDLIKLRGNKRKSRRPTLVSAQIDELGIEVPSFDHVIDRMNRIQDEIIWSGE